MIERHIDYIQFSASISEQICLEYQYEIVSPMRFYSRGYRDEYGYRLYYGNPNSKKAFVVASGDALLRKRSLGFSDSNLFDEIFRRDGNITRLDIAVTEFVEDELFTVEDVGHWYSSGLVVSTLSSGGAKTISELSESGNSTLQTLYIGDMKKRAKKGIFRAYDKGVELDIGAYMATRIEIEDRGEKAHNSALRIAEGASLGGVFRSRFDVQHETFDRLMDAETVDTTRGGAKWKEEDENDLDNRWIWLMKQVAPALKDAIEADEKLGKGKARLVHFLKNSGMKDLAECLNDDKF